MTTQVVEETHPTRERSKRRPIHLASQLEQDFARALRSPVRAYCGKYCQMPEKGLPYVSDFGPKVEVCPACRKLADEDKS